MSKSIKEERTQVGRKHMRLVWESKHWSLGKKLREEPSWPQAKHIKEMANTYQFLYDDDKKILIVSESRESGGKGKRKMSNIKDAT